MKHSAIALVFHLLQNLPNPRFRIIPPYIYTIYTMEFYHSNDHMLNPTKRKMKAARYYGPGNVKSDQVPEPQAKDG
jgi:hypothetical protein